MAVSKRLVRSMCAAQVAVALCAGGAGAADDVDPFALSPEQLFDATVMSVSKTNERLGDAPAAIYILTAEDIQRSGATSIAEALRLVPGVQVARGNASSWAISVRGLNSGLANKLLVLIDGREVYDALFSGVYWDVQDTMLEDIERIEIIRGPGASLWGANAVNGVINIITKKASATKGALVSAIGGTQDRAIVSGRYGAEADGAHWRVYAKYLDRAPHDMPSGANAEDEWRAWRGGLRADWEANGQGDSFTLQGDIYTSRSGQFRSVPQLTAPYAVTREEDITASGGNLLGRWNRDLGEGSNLALQAYVDLTSRDQLTLENDRKVFDIDVQYDFPALGAHDVVVGARYRYSVEEMVSSPVITVVQATRRDQLISGFVQDKITLEPERWFLTVGSKFEHNDFSGFEIQPSARLHWLGDDQMAWAAVSRAVRTPSLLEHNMNVLARVFAPPPFLASLELWASPGFESEELIAYEAGYRKQWSPALTTDISAFYNDYDKLATLSFIGLDFDPSPPAHFIFPVGMTNLTHGEIYGAEFVVNWRAAENLNFSAAYSFLEIELHGPPSNVAIASEAAEGQSPQNQFNLRAQWDVTKSVAFDSTLYYADELPGFGVPSYWRVDARLGWRVADGLDLEVVGQNLFDDSHREFGAATDANAAEVARAVYGRVTWRL